MPLPLHFMLLEQPDPRSSNNTIYVYHLTTRGWRSYSKQALYVLP